MAKLYSNYSVAIKSIIAGQFVVTFSCVATILATFIQPLAGSLFLVRSTASNIGISANGLMAVGLNPITPTLIPFVEASGVCIVWQPGSTTNPLTLVS